MRGLAKEFLSQKGVPFEAKNVTEDQAAGEELVAGTGRSALPVIIVGDEVVSGFDRGRLGICRTLMGYRDILIQGRSCREDAR